MMDSARGPDEEPITFFWWDTLAIPRRDPNALGGVPQNFDDLKKRSIQLIYKVFVSSSISLLIDKDLHHKKEVRDPSLVTAVKLLTSLWMRRLWTLQEAFLSQDICITLYDRQERNRYPGKSLDELMKQMNPVKDEQDPLSRSILKRSLAGMLRRHLFENLTFEGREIQKRGDGAAGSDRRELIAGVLRAARWRVSHGPHRARAS